MYSWAWIPTIPEVFLLRLPCGNPPCGCWLWLCQDLGYKCAGFCVSSTTFLTRLCSSSCAWSLSAFETYWSNFFLLPLKKLGYVFRCTYCHSRWGLQQSWNALDDESSWKVKGFLLSFTITFNFLIIYFKKIFREKTLSSEKPVPKFVIRLSDGKWQKSKLLCDNLLFKRWGRDTSLVESDFFWVMTKLSIFLHVQRFAKITTCRMGVRIQP